MKLFLRLAAVVSLAVLVTACDKCGNVNINLPNFDGAKTCSPQSPQR
jgi:hypothetical protein